MNEKVEVVCKHCEGTGKCGCLTCILEYLTGYFGSDEHAYLSSSELEEKALEWNDDKRTVVCFRCKGTGSRYVVPSENSSEKGGFRDV